MGLGNPGREYAHHRHNVGARCLQFLSRQSRIPLEQRLAGCRVGRGVIAGREVLLARPQSYMNQSGPTVAALLRRLKAKPADLLVLCDDLDLPLGRLRLRPDGSSGGHRGLESIIQSLGGSRNFARLRIGIGRPPGETPSGKGEAVVNHVLSDFTPVEGRAFQEVMLRAAEAIGFYLEEGLEVAMSRFN